VAKQPDTDRHSAPVRTKRLRPLTKAEKAAQEATNTLLQYDRTLGLIEEGKASRDRFRWWCRSSGGKRLTSPPTTFIL
jgi:hypothetical protein